MKQYKIAEKNNINERRITPADNDKQSYFDPSLNCMVVKVMPGEFIVTAEPSDMLVTTLGSCVSACIRDPHTGIGGMNHFMLPSSEGKTTWGGSSAALRYGNHAMEMLINEILRNGCPRQDMEIKVFGGGNVTKSSNDVGSDNARFVLKYLDNEGLKIEAQDLGGIYPRRIRYFPSIGKVDRLLLRRKSDDVQINTEEKAYQNKLQKNEVGHDAELFNDK